MATRTPGRPRVDVTFENACGLFEEALDGPSRQHILDAAQSTGGFDAAVARLRSAMLAHVFPTSATPLELGRVVRHLDNRTRAEGFHVLQSWDYRAHRFVDDHTAVLMLDRVASGGIPRGDEQERATLSTLLDQYFLMLLGLLAVRAWDDGDANANFDRVTRILTSLNGPNGSGHRFVEGSELLLLLAVSQYHPKEPAYDFLLTKVMQLDAPHRGNVALVCAASLGSHLRWGFRLMYARDIVRMRDDNVVDYPWLLASIETLLDAYCRARDGDGGQLERDTITEALINGLSADPSAFTGAPPPSLHAHESSHAKVRELLASRRLDLLSDFERHRPDKTAYSPIAFESNFLNNVAVAMIATGAGTIEPHPSLDVLLTRQRATAATPSAIDYARRLTRYAGATAAVAGGPALIVYDLHDASSRFDAALRTLRGE